MIFGQALWNKKEKRMIVFCLKYKDSYGITIQLIILILSDKSKASPFLSYN